VTFSTISVLFVDESKHNKEGRVITAEYEKFFFVAACKCIVFSSCN